MLYAKKSLYQSYIPVSKKECGGGRGGGVCGAGTHLNSQSKRFLVELQILNLRRKGRGTPCLVLSVHCFGMTKFFILKYRNTGYPLHRENRENGKKSLSGTTQGALFAQVVDSLFLMVMNIAILPAKISIFFQKLDMSAKSVLCM